MATINDNFFDALGKGATWAAGVAFQRSNPLPLDKYSVFETRALAEEYATTNAVAYPGQIVAFIEDNEMKVCVLAETADEIVEGEEQTYSLGLQEIGGKIDLDNTSLSFNEETGLLEISGFNGAATATLPQKKIAEDGTETIEWVTVDAIVEGDGNTTYTVTPLKKNVGTEEAPVEEIYGFTLTPSEGAATEIKLDVYTKTEVDDAIIAAVEAEETRATAAEEALDAKIGTASSGSDEEGNYVAATGIMADIEALETLKADVTYVDDEIAGLEDAISKLNHFTTEIVASTDDVKAEGILYLIKDESVAGVDKYNEYLYVNNEPVLIGDTTTDLSDYYDKDEIDGKVSTINGAISGEVEAREALAERVTTLENVDNATQDELDTYKGEVTTALGLKADQSALDTLEESLYNGSYTVGEETKTSNIVEADREAARLIAPDEIAKLSALVLDEDGSVGVSGTISADNVDGLETKIVSVVTGAVVEGTNALGVEKGAQVNKIEKVVFNGTQATVADKVATIAGEYYTESEVDAKIKTVTDALADVQTTANTAKSTAEANSIEIGTLKTTVGNHKDSIDENAADIAALVTKVAIEEGKVGTLESAVADKADSSTVNALAGRVGANEGNITSLTSRVAANETSLNSINEDLVYKANSNDVYNKTAIDNKTGVIPEGKTLVQMIAEAQTAATYDDAQVKADIAANTAAIATLNGDETTPGSVAKTADDRIAAALLGADADFDTLKEMSDWLSSHADSAATMNTAIQDNTAAITKLNADVNTEGSVLSMIAANAPKIATVDTAGIVKSVASTVENGIAVAADGTMSVNSVNVNKLVQTEGEFLILNGGSAAV